MLLQTAIPGRRLAHKLLNMSEDWLLNIDSRGVSPSSKPGYIYYASIDYYLIRNVLQRLELRASDVFVDIGAGKGRVICLASQCKVKLVVGIEFESQLAAIAKVNVIRMRGRRTPVEVHAQAAEEFDYSSATVLYLFNPFEADILDIVLEKVNSDRAGRPVRVAFVMESAEQRSVFKSHKWLHCYERWVDAAEHANALYRTE
jgi:SAM-dependent methyltransferase